MALSKIKTNIQKWETKGEPQANGSYKVRPMTAWLSSTGISHHDLLPHIPLLCLSANNSSPLQSLNSSSQLLRLPGDQHRGICVYGKDCLVLNPFRLPQVSCFTLRLKCFSSDSDNCPSVGIGSLLPFSHPPREGLVLLTLLFSPLVPSSYWVLCGSIYSFPLARYSCPLSAVVLHALLCLKVYFWWIHGDVLHVHLLLHHLVLPLVSLFLFEHS